MREAPVSLWKSGVLVRNRQDEEKWIAIHANTEVKQPHQLY
jgi:hypothetical protein